MKQVKIPFSLPEYKKGIYKVETRDGKPVRILCTDAKRVDPIQALVLENNGYESTCSYLIYGTCDGHNHEKYDLVLVKEIFENGDIISNDGYPCIIKKIEDIKIEYYVLMNYENDELIFNDSFAPDDDFVTELATEEEKNMILSKLEEYGKCWDPDKKEIVDIKCKCPFKLMDDVLVRDSDDYPWKYTMFCHYKNNKKEYYPFVCVDSAYEQCIPLNDETKHLLRTNQDCPEKYKIW